MTKSRDTDDEFDDKIRNKIPYLRTNQPRLVTTTSAQSNLTSLEGLLTNPTTGWIYIFGLYKNPNTRTKLVTEQKNHFRDLIENKMHLVYADIPDSSLTDEDRTILEIPRRDTTTTPVTLVNYSPMYVVDNVGHSVFTMRIFDPNTPDSKAMPHKHHCHLMVGFKATPTGPIVWDGDRVSEPHESLFDVYFKPEDTGKVAFIRIRYVSSTGELGIWGLEISNIVM